MCLTTKNKEGLVSDEAIKCYKVYLKGEEDGVIKSLVQGTEYCVKEGDVIEAEGRECMDMKDYETGPWTLGEGYIHAFRTRYGILPALSWNYGAIKAIMNNEGYLTQAERSTIERLLDILLCTIDSVILYEMEIPVGERYWIGVAGDICAKKMILAKEFKITKRSKLLELIMENHYDTYALITEQRTRGVIKKYEDLIKEYKEKGE